MITISPIQPQQIPAAKQVMAEVCNEIWKIKPTVEELAAWFEARGEFADLNTLPTTYPGTHGIFLVATDGGRVVATGAVKRLSEEICELKRMWILSAYRAHGLGLRIARQLITFASDRGYRKMRLEVYDPPMQKRAVAFYEQLGFSAIAPYRSSPAQLAMEKILGE